MPESYPVQWDRGGWGQEVGGQFAQAQAMFRQAREREQERRRREEQEQYERTRQAVIDQQAAAESERKAKAFEWEQNDAKLKIQEQKLRMAKLKHETATQEAQRQGSEFLASEPEAAQHQEAYFTPGEQLGEQAPPGGLPSPPPQMTIPAVPSPEPGEPDLVAARTVSPFQMARAALEAKKAAERQEGLLSGRLVEQEGGDVLPASVVNARETAKQRAETAAEARAATAENARLNRENARAIAEAARAGRPAKPPTGAENAALGFFLRGKSALEDAAQFEDQVAKTGLMGQARLQWAPNVLQSSEQQLYRQAQRAFTEARLRKESGAAIPPAEYENDAKTYFAQPGDKPAVIDRKRARRLTVLESLRTGAGRAYANYTGEEPPTAENAPKTGEGPAVGSVVRGYRFKGGNPADRASWEKVQ